MSRHTPQPTRRKLSVALFAVVVAVALGACQDESSPLAPPAGPEAAKTGTGKPGTTETVLFAGTKDGNTDVYAMNPDGSNVRRLTAADSAKDISPDFAPGNRKFVYVHEVGVGKSELFVANADGSKPTQLTTMGATVGQPRYSPDGTKIVFTAQPPSHPREIFVVNADGSGAKRITYEESDEESPTWSPDGGRIAFASNRDGGVMKIYTMTADGLDVRQAGECYGGCTDPAFSPTEPKLAYANLADGNIMVLNLDLNADDLMLPLGPASAPGVSRYPTWSKDGTRVVFASTRGYEGKFELYAGTVGDSTASSIRRLTVFSPGAATAPAYSH